MSDLTESLSDVNLHIHIDKPIIIQHTVAPNDALLAMLQSIDSKLQVLTMAISDVNSAIQQLQQDVTQETTVNQSAITLIQGFPALIAAAVAAAQAAGATPAQLQSFTDLSTAIEGQSTALAAAVTAGTPAAGGGGGSTVPGGASAR